MYQALYRKWRPQIFDDVIGQKHITDSLRNQVASGHLSHAYLFIGTRGTGKTTCARILAKAVNCEHPENGNPCGKCASCRGIAEGTVMDVVELDAASNNGVDNVRALRDEAVFSPVDVKKRVYIIDEVHMLSTSAFNALLKIIEEPPAHLMFILATTELQKVPATILSRCQRHSFRRIDKPELCRYIEKIASAENISITHDAADLIAGLSEGGVRDALSMLDQCSAYGSVGTEQVYSAVGLAGNLKITEIFSDICSHNAPAALSLFDSLWRDGKDPASFIKELSGFIRDILITKLAPGSASGLVYGGYDSSTLAGFAEKLSADDLYAALDTLQNALRNISSRLNPKMTAELCLVSLCNDLSGDSLASLKARVSRLEQAISEGKVIPVSAGTTAEETLRQPSCVRPSATAVPEPESVRMTAPPSVSENEKSPDSISSERPDIPVKEHPEEAEIKPEITVRKAENVSSSSLSDSGWSKILAYVGPLLPVGVRVLLSDPLKVSSSVEGDTFFIDVAPGNEFISHQIMKDSVISKFEAAVSSVFGRSLNIRVRERKIETKAEKQHGNLDELRKFSEVTFN
ncbi:MAG: DNA polymerase III subunit gamma/tau [Eubacteriales bacterium]|nr:DNA polymerase III subunit gamma/tau [Eubacteriales bacterium]